MKKKSTADNRELRIELLRARAMLERQSLRRNAASLADSLTPSALVKSMLPQSLSKKGASGWLMEGIDVLRRYPFLASSVSALFSGVGKRHRLLRLGAGLLLSWKIARSVSETKRPG